MNKKLVLLRLDGELSEVIKATLEIGEEDSPHFLEERGKLPPAPWLSESYKFFYEIYRHLDGQSRIKVKSGKKNVNLDLLKANCKDKADSLRQNFNDWLQVNEFSNVVRKCSQHLKPDDEVRVIICSSDNQIRKLPWHYWEAFKDYPKVEFALSGLTAQLTKRIYRQNIRILIVLGNSEGIQVAEDEKLLRQYCSDAETVFLVEPERQQLNEYLWDERGWDILFFSGHSQTEGDRGRIYLNQTDSLTLEELKYGLETAVNQGLQIALFNSCDGLGLAAFLETLHIPQVIVMREPVPDKVAQQFLKYFLKEFTSGTSLYQAVGIARKKLQGWEHEYPCASWLPVIVQNFLETPPSWISLGAISRCPYRGLAAFREEDAPYFYGREEFTQKLITAANQKSFVALIGSSGSGKSSVVFAGLIPYLKKTREWQAIAFRPGNNPFESLAAALIEAGINYTPTATEDKHQQRFAQLELEVELRSSDRALENIVTCVNATASRRLRILLVADQFEELYTQCPDPQERQRFLDNLLNAVRNAPFFTLTLTLRADFYSDALSYPPLAEALQNAQFNLSSMTAQELRTAIETPAANLNVQFQAGLSERLLSSILNSPSHLPLLQFTLSQLWERQQKGWLTHEAYNEMGGLLEGLAKYAEGVYAQLNPEDRERVQQVFLQLVQPNEGAEDTRRLAKREEVGAENWDLVTSLAASRLVVTNWDEIAGVETVEIVHEALIKYWQRLRQWLEGDREFRRWQEQLRAAMRQWENSGKDEEALLRGKTLAVAEDWLQRRSNQIGSAEGRFIGLSLNLRDKEQKQKERQKQRTILALTGGLLTALVLLAVIQFQWQQAESARNQAQINEVKALNNSAQALFSSNKQLAALREILRADIELNRISRVDEATKISVISTLADILVRIRERNRLEGHEGLVSSVSFNANGDLMASGSFDKSIKIWGRDGTLIQSLQAEDPIYSVSFSADGQVLTSLSNNNKVYLWRRNWKTHRFETRPYMTIPDTENLLAMSFSRDGRAIATANTNGSVKIWNLQGKVLKAFPAHQGKIWSLSFSPDGRTLATASADKTVKLWDLQGKLLQTFLGHEKQVLTVNFSPNGRLLASAGKDGNIKLWQVDGKLLETFNGEGSDVSYVSFSPDNQLIASAHEHNTVKIWQIGQKEPLETLSGHADIVSHVTFSPDGKTVASASKDKTIVVWGINNINSNHFQGRTFSFSADNRKLALGGKDGKVILLQRDSQQQRSFSASDKKILKLAFSRDGKMLITVDADGKVKFWNEYGNLLNSWQSDRSIVSVNFSRDQEIIATAGNDGAVKIWDFHGKLRYSLLGHSGKILAIAFSPDGAMLATASEDKTVKLWSRQGKLLHTFSGYEGSVLAVSFNQKGSIIATASVDKQVKFWHLNGELAQTLPHPETVYGLTFSADNQVFATASHDGVLRLWSIDGELLHEFKADGDALMDVSFSPDGKVLVSTDLQNNVKLWNLNEKDLQKRGCEWLRDYLVIQSNRIPLKNPTCALESN